jgi:hypothetical protein
VSHVRCFSLASIALVSLLAVSAEAAHVRREGAQLRAATGFSGAVLASPASGEPVEILESSNEWRRVRTSAGVEGWLHELFLDEAARRPARVARPEARPGAVPRAEPFEAPPIDERTEAPPAAELERLRRELATERAARADAVRELNAALASQDRLEKRVGLLEAEVERFEAAASGEAAENRSLRRRLADDAARLRRESEDSRGREIAALEAGHAEELASLEAAHASALAAAEERHEKSLAEARTANTAEIAELQQRLLADQDRIGESFVEKCSELHAREMARKDAEWAATCDERERLQRAEHAKELRKVSKESGWEEEFDREVRSAVREQVEERLAEAKLRWEAKHRGDAVELEKELAKAKRAMEAECESRVLAAVNAELERHRKEMGERMRALQAEEERRCRTALALVLERNAAGAPAGTTPPTGGRP